ncbi:MAG: hypothetical protein KF843_02340 [Flavobacteriales bacterium]|nr:hypothetical protein [Flavobacteriales bacterium]
MKLWLATGALALLVPFAGMAQRAPEFHPTAQGFLFLPIALDNPVFDNLTDVLGQVDGAFQLPLYKGFGAGVGVNATWYELNENALAPEYTLGDVNRLVFYGKLTYSHYTGARTFYELNAKLGQSTWKWNCRTCAGNDTQSGFHWGLNAAFFLHATDNLAFGLSVGYQQDATSFGPGVVGLESFPGRTDTGGPYRFLNVGLGFSTTFQKGDEGVW